MTKMKKTESKRINFAFFITNFLKMKHNCKFILKDDKGQIFNLHFYQKNPIKWTEVYLPKIQGALSK